MRRLLASVSTVCILGAVTAGCSMAETPADAAQSATAGAEAEETTAASTSTPGEPTPADPADFGQLFGTWIDSGVPVVDWARSVCEAFDQGESTATIETSVDSHLQDYRAPGGSSSWAPAESQLFVDNSVGLYCPEHLPLIQN